jgi:sensor domain CHASE-containing protein/anti-anti-sigma regulatory factor
MLNNGTPSQPPARAGLAPAAPSENAPQHFRSLRIRLSVIIALIIMAMLVLLYVPLRLTVLDAFVDLDQQSVETNLGRSSQAFDARLVDLGKKVKDYANWDDTYALADDPQPDLVAEYVSSNLDNEIYNNYGLNVIMLVDPQGTITFSKSLAIGLGAPIAIPAEIEALAGTPFLTYDESSKGVQRVGIVRMPDTAMMVGVASVLPTSAAGSPRGAMLFGRFLTQDEVNTLASVTNLNLSLHSLDPAQPLRDITEASPLPAEVASQLKAGQNDIVKTISDEQIQGFSLVKDIDGQPALAIQLDAKRDIFTQGQRSSNYFVVALVSMALVLSIVVTWLLQRFVLARLSRLNTEVGVIAADGDTTERVTVQGRDELAQLSLSINSMLGALQRAEEEHTRSDEEKVRLQDDLIRAQQVTLEKLSTPVIPISDTVIVMPLIGEMDANRGELILKTLLQGISQMRTRTAIIDITGISGVNEEAITLLTRMVGTVRLLGTELILTGISAEVARMLAKRPGVLHGVMTYSNLQQAIVYALKA